MSVTQKDIADELGVSIITVSRALRGHPDLAEGTRSKILSKAAEMGYSKIESAKNSDKKVDRIGVILYQESGSPFFESNLLHHIFASLETECQKYGVEIVLQFNRDGEVPLCVKNRTVDAVCLMGSYSADMARFSESMPTLSVSRYVPGLKVPRVVADNIGGASKLTEHLIELGHRKIIFLTHDCYGQLKGIFQDRAGGYLMAMSQHGLPTETQVLNGPVYSPDVVLDLADKFTAVVASSDSVALQILQILEGKKLHAPQKISVVGFDDIPDSSRYGLTTYAPDWKVMGKLAASQLIFHPQDLLHSEFQLIAPGELLLRKTTAAI